MRPHVICHMMSTIDGRIDGEALRSLADTEDYEITGQQLESDAWICGRTTMQQHFADEAPFVSKTNRPAGPQPVHVAQRAESYAISVDTTGKLKWSSSDIDGDHIICIVSERAPEDYLSMLRDVGASYIVAGSNEVDLATALELLHDHFGIRRLLLEGGGHINAGFVEAELLDEISLLIAPGIDARKGLPTVFDGRDAASQQKAVQLRLKTVEQRESDMLWIRYDVIR
jgi:2,5-diamino-6-(ribosylamino)-4(3H)-pyrimidinone 5'-phosphate reductase